MGRNKKIVCFRCGRPGHIARVCPQGNRGYIKGGLIEKWEMCVDANDECVDTDEEC